MFTDIDDLCCFVDLLGLLAVHDCSVVFKVVLFVVLFDCLRFNGLCIDVAFVIFDVLFRRLCCEFPLLGLAACLV